MGGIGSGRQLHSLKRKTDDYFSIDIRVWAQESMIAQGQKNGWRWTYRDKPVACLYVVAGQNEIELYPLVASGRARLRATFTVKLTWTECAIGGKRPWFLCPLQGCTRRVAILYWGKSFGCRQCFDLAYASENENSFDRAARRAGWIRKKLKWAPGILNPVGTKPKGMHMKTYQRLINEYCDRTGLAFKLISTQLPYMCR